jgi:hypothetical protein
MNNIIYNTDAVNGLNLKLVVMYIRRFVFEYPFLYFNRYFQYIQTQTHTRTRTYIYTHYIYLLVHSGVVKIL